MFVSKLFVDCKGNEYCVRVLIRAVSILVCTGCLTRGLLGMFE